MKKVKQEDLKLGLYLLTHKGTGFVVGFEAEKAGLFYMYLISNETLFNTKKGVQKYTKAEQLFTQYIKGLSEIALQNAMDKTLLVKLKSNAAKKALELPKIDASIITQWRLKSRLMDNTLPEMADIRPNIHYVPGKVYIVTRGSCIDVEVLCLTDTKFVPLERLGEVKKNLQGRNHYFFLTKQDMLECKVRETDKTIDLREFWL